jgi:uncharacterized membrane protein YvbJ
MVYCVKCGTKNPDDAQVCSKCGAQLYTTGESKHYRRMENECFGLPRGGMIAGIVIGLIIILAGVSFLVQAVYPQINFPWWPFVLIIFGVLILAGALYNRR